jgi:transcriptional antiterminator NusG
MAIPDYFAVIILTDMPSLRCRRKRMKINLSQRLSFELSIINSYFHLYHTKGFFMYWYAIFVETGYEETVQQYLIYNFADLYPLIPKRFVPEKKDGKFKKVVKKLFPGYLLIRAKLDDAMFQKMKNIPHLIKVLGYGSKYNPIAEAEIAIILRLINNEGIIDYSKIFIENSLVNVNEGPLKGLEWLIVKVNKHTRRVKIKLNFLGEARMIEVGMDM